MERTFSSTAQVETWAVVYTHLDLGSCFTEFSLLSFATVSQDNRNCLILSLKSFFSIVSLSINAGKKHSASLLFLFFDKLLKVLYSESLNSLFYASELLKISNHRLSVLVMLPEESSVTVGLANS